MRLPPHDAGSPVLAIGRRHPKLGVTIVRIAPAPAFEQAVGGGNLRKRPARRQMTTRVHHAAAELTHIQCLSAGMHAVRRTVARTNAAHEENAGAVVALQIIDVGLEARRVGNANTGARAGLARCDNAR